MTISKYVHKCIISEGDLAGNEYWQDVDAFDYEFRAICHNCGERLVNGRKLLAHIYNELLD